MGVIRAEPARMTDWAVALDRRRLAGLRPAARRPTRALLATLGLVMAYTNSVEQGQLGPRAAARRSSAA